MRHDDLKKELDLLVLLTQNRQYTPDVICQKIGISRRSFYYYLEFFRGAGFKVEKYNHVYSLSRESPFFLELSDQLHFTNEEAVLLRQIIENVDVKTVRLKALQNKLESFYDFRILEDEELQQRVSRTLSRLTFAMKNHRMVKIINYSSNNSRSVKDRIVEPFLFLNNNNDVRCHEPASGQNKTFRLSRMEKVEVLDTVWENEDKHKKIFFDMFMFSGEQHYSIELILGQVAHTLMVEEHPQSAACMVKREDGRWLFRTEVCSYVGIGRFIFGLYDDVEILGDEGLREYVNVKLIQWTSEIQTKL